MHKNIRLFMAAAAIASAMGAQAAVVVSKDLSNPVSIPGLTGFETTGALMSGMSVTATFSSGFSQQLNWATTGFETGRVSGDGWSLSVTGDTFDNVWDFNIDGQSNLGQLTSLTLDGAPGLTVFDTWFGGLVGTVGSARGLDFTLFSGCDSCEVTAIYSVPVAISPADAVGDLFHRLTVTFTGGTGPRANWSFFQDTDNDSRINQAPEPGSMALAGLALVALGALRRRRAH